MVALVIIPLIVEYFNITTYTTFMKGILRQSVQNSCDYFAQETYKSSSTGGALGARGNLRDLRDRDGITVSPLIYDGTEEEIYNNLYGKTSEFANWYGTPGIKGTWLNLDMLANGAGIRGASGSSGLSLKGRSSKSLTQAEKATGKSYYENHMTPLNLGIAYLDKDTVERIAKWNIISNFSMGQYEKTVDGRELFGLHNVVSPDSDPANRYVQYNGFKIYFNTFKVSNISYRVYDLKNPADVSEIERYTNINYKTGTGNGGKALKRFDGDNYNDGADRQKICVAKIDYEIFINYEGVTPLTRIMNYTNSKVVAGFSDTPLGGGNYDPIINNPNHHIMGNVYKSGRKTAVDSFGSHVIPLTSSITYYVIR